MFIVVPLMFIYLYANQVHVLHGLYQSGRWHLLTEAYAYIKFCCVKHCVRRGCHLLNLNRNMPINNKWFVRVPHFNLLAKKRIRSDIIKDCQLTHAVSLNDIQYEWIHCNMIIIMLMKHLLEIMENTGLCSRVFILLHTKYNNILEISFIL